MTAGIRCSQTGREDGVEFSGEVFRANVDKEQALDYCLFLMDNGFEQDWDDGRYVVLVRSEKTMTVSAVTEIRVWLYHSVLEDYPATTNHGNPIPTPFWNLPGWEGSVF